MNTPSTTFRAFRAPLLCVMALLYVGTAAMAAPGDKTRAALDTLIGSFAGDGGDLREVVPTVSKATGIPILLDAGVTGTVNFEVEGFTVRQFLTATCSANGLHYIIHPDEYVLIRNRVTRIYPIDFLAAEKMVSLSSSTSVSSGGVGTSGGGMSGSTGGATGGGSSSGSSTGGASGGSTSAAANQFTMSSKNDTVLWKEMEDQAKLLMKKDEIFLLNRTGGFAQLDASLATHAAFEAYWRNLIESVNRGVRVKITVLDVSSNNSSRLGIDWDMAANRLGSLGGKAITVGGSMVDPTSGLLVSGLKGNTGAFKSVGTVELPPNTFMGTLGVGKVTALISALSEQGDVTKKSSPTVALLNNRSAVIQVSLDKNFFSRQQDYEVIQSGSVGGSAVANGTRYTSSTYSFGILFAVTAQVSATGITTLDLEPTLTDYVGLDSSADGTQNLPSKNTQKVQTQVRLMSGQSYVLGGYVRTIEGMENRSVPGLSRIPYIGRAFQNEAKVKQTSEMVFIVTAELAPMPMVSPIEVITPDPSQGYTAEVAASAPRHFAVPVTNSTSAVFGVPAGDETGKPPLKAKESMLLTIP